MKINILKMSYYIENSLKCTSVGTIHSVYRKTINLSLGKTLAALQTEASPISPISLITNLSASDIEKLSLKPGDRINLHDNMIEAFSSVGIHHISYKEAKRYNLFLPARLDDDSCGLLIKNIKAALSCADTTGFSAIFNSCPEDRLSLMLLAAKKRITHSLELYKNKKPQEAGNVLSGLLGLGIGLTPSGDDFLCGVLAGLRLSGLEDDEFAKALKNGISEHLTDTVDISAAFLSCALHNQYSLAVNCLGGIPAPEVILDMFSEIGHSSGMDTLCGVLYALSLHTKK